MNEPDPSQTTAISSSLADPPPKQSAPRTTYGHGGRKRSAPPPSLKKPKTLSNVVEDDEDDGLSEDDLGDDPTGTGGQKQARRGGPASSDAYDELPASNRKLANPIAKREPPPKVEAKGDRASSKKRKIVKEEEPHPPSFDQDASPPRKQNVTKAKAVAPPKKFAAPKTNAATVAPKIKAKAKPKKTDDAADEGSSPQPSEARSTSKGARTSTRKSAAEAKKKIAAVEPEQDDLDMDDLETEEYLADLAEAKKPKKVDAAAKAKPVEKMKASAGPSAVVDPAEDGYGYPADDNDLGADAGEQTMDPITDPVSTKKKKASVYRDAATKDVDPEWLSDLGSNTQSQPRTKEVDPNSPAAKKESRPAKPVKRAESSTASKIPVASSRLNRLYEDGVLPSPIKRAGSRKSDVAPWDADVQERLDANLAQAGLEGYLDSPHSDLAPSDSASHLPRNVPNSKSGSTRLGRAAAESPAASNKALSLVSTGSRMRAPGRVADSDEERTRLRRSAARTPGIADEGPQGHSTPKQTIPKKSRTTVDATTHEQPSSTKPKPRPKPRPNINATPASAAPRPSASGVKPVVRHFDDPSSGDVVPEPDRTATAVERNKTEPAALRVEEPLASSSRATLSDQPRETTAARTAKPLNVTLAGARVSHRPLAVEERSAPPSSIKKPRGILAGVRPDRRRGDVASEGTQIKQTLDVIVSELTKRHVKRIKKTQAHAKDTQVRLTGDTQKLALHLVTRTSSIVDASQKHHKVMRELNLNIASTTRDARTKSDKVVSELENIAVREERRADAWPERFFA